MKDTYKRLQTEYNGAWGGPSGIVHAAIAGRSNDWICRSCQHVIGVVDIDAYARCGTCIDCSLKA